MSAPLREALEKAHVDPDSVEVRRRYARVQIVALQISRRVWLGYRP